MAEAGAVAEAGNMDKGGAGARVRARAKINNFGSATLLRKMMKKKQISRVS